MIRCVIAACLAFACLPATMAVAACALPPPPLDAIAPGPAPQGNRLPIDAGPLLFGLNGSAIYPVTGTDGLLHLSFSVLVTNVTPSPVTIDGVEPLDAASGSPFGVSGVVSMSGVDVSKQVYLFSKPATTDDASFSSTLPPGQAGALYLDIPVTASTRLPAYLGLRLASTMALAPGKDVAFKTTGRPMPVSCDPVIVLAPPLRGPGWVDGNGCCKVVSPHRWVLLPVSGSEHPAEQFAIDFVQVDARGKLFAGPMSDIASWLYYGADVLAAGAGTVVEVVDGLPDGVPGKNPVTVETATAAGNHVIVDMGSDRYALYAHLKPGSVAVKVGQAVAQGDRLGALGDSGNSDAPHLHFHVTDRPSALDATGVPFVFDRMRLAGRSSMAGGPAIDRLMAGKPMDLDADGARQVVAVMPLMLDVLDFR